jgi:colanic acid biosynthesis glycosyl transferase WcaI
MKILFLGLNHAPEEIGIGLYSGDMTRAWARAGHDVRVIAAAPYYPAWKVFDGYAGKGWARSTEEGVDVTRCPIYVPQKPSGVKRVVHHLSFLAAALPPMLKAAIGGKPDIVFTVAPSLIAAPLAWLAARLSGAKCWLHVQDFEMEAALVTGLVNKGGLAGRLGPWFERTVIGLFDYASSISPQMCAKLIEKGVPKERTYELRNWADLAAIRPFEGVSPYRAEWGIKTPHVALYSGNIANKQGIEVVLEAARLLYHRKDLTFVVCGQGPNRAALEAAAGGLENIQFHDLQSRERLNELLGMASVHLMPQLAGAADLVLPSKLTNMLASGRPVVATADPGTGLGDEVQGCGLLTPPGSAVEFARGIETLLDDPGLSARYAHEARTRAEDRWSKAKVLDRLDSKLMVVAGGLSLTSLGRA